MDAKVPPMKGLTGAGRATVLVAFVAAGVGCLAAPEAETGAVRGTVVLPSGRTISVELARTPQELARGYQFRESVPDGEGMLFFMGRLGLHSFWMKDCLTALDILWLNERWEIVHLEAAVPPCVEEPCPSYAPMQASLYILEIGPGEAARLGLRLGDRLTYIPPRGAGPEP